MFIFFHLFLKKKQISHRGSGPILKYHESGTLKKYNCTVPAVVYELAILLFGQRPLLPGSNCEMLRRLREFFLEGFQVLVGRDLDGGN
jgi:hypothetical protein